jgi:hypothetical protein
VGASTIEKRTLGVKPVLQATVSVDKNYEENIFPFRCVSKIVIRECDLTKAMADPPSGDPGGNPTNTPQSVTLFSASPRSSTPELRRITRGYKRQRNDPTAFTATNRTPDIQFIGERENSTKLDEVVGLIADLKKIIIEQNNTIGNLKADLGQIRAEQANLKNQNAELQDEIRCLRTQLNANSTPASSPGTSPRSWASVAASSGTTTTVPSLPSLPRKDNVNKEPNCVRISIQPRSAGQQDTETSFARYLPTESSNAHIRNALVTADTTKDVQVAGIGTTKTGYIIRFKDPQSAETARNNAEWLKTLGNGTKLVKPRFGVVVHRVPTAQFSLPEHSTEGIQRIMDDNDFLAKGFQVDEITWLKRPEKPLERMHRWECGSPQRKQPIGWSITGSSWANNISAVSYTTRSNRRDVTGVSDLDTLPSRVKSRQGVANALGNTSDKIVPQEPDHDA